MALAWLLVILIISPLAIFYGLFEFLIHNRNVFHRSSSSLLRSQSSITPVIEFNDLVGIISQTVSNANNLFVIYINPTLPGAGEGTGAAIRNFLFTFTELNINSAQFFIHDGRGANATILYSCVSCGHFIPPSFFSKTGFIEIRVVGISGASFYPSIFTLHYIAVLAKYDALQYLPQPPRLVLPGSSYSNISVDMYMGSADISPIVIQGRVPPSYQSTWKLLPSLSDIQAGKTFLFSFVSFNQTYFNSNCGGSVPSRVHLTIKEVNSNKILYQNCNSSFHNLEKGWWFRSSVFATSVEVLFENNNIFDTYAATATATPAPVFSLKYTMDTDLYHW
jgi:hypothetical protein